MIGVVKYDKAQCGTLCFVVGSSFPEKWLHWKKKSIKVAISKVNQSMLRCGTLFLGTKGIWGGARLFFSSSWKCDNGIDRCIIYHQNMLDWRWFLVVLICLIGIDCCTNNQIRKMYIDFFLHYSLFVSREQSILILTDVVQELPYRKNVTFLLTF